MNPSGADQRLAAIVDAANVVTIADVIATMTAIDGVLAPNDGLKWFNQLYLDVTKKVDTAPPAGGWEDATWLTRLDVVFAGFYFAAVKDWIADAGSVPSSWQALF